MDAWIAAEAERIAGDAPEQIERLVNVSSPSGDLAGAEAAIAAVTTMLPDAAEVERVPCSTPGHADDFVARVRGDGERRVVLVGHLDTVFPHSDHHPLIDQGDRLVGSGTVDMKGGDVVALGVLRALAEGAGAPPFAEVALLLVNDEEWRLVPFAHVDRFAGFDACLCFEAGQLGPVGEEAVVVRRKAAGTLRVKAHGREAHSGSAPDKGVSALLALTQAAQAIAAANDPKGEDALTAVPTIFRSGDAFNVVPAAGEVIADLRADSEAAFERVIAAVPEQVGGARLEPELLRRWPGMDSRDAVAPALARAAELLGEPLHAGARGGASDASHLAGTIPLTIDGLGPRGGGAHAPHEFVLTDSLGKRARVALAVAAAALGV
ncbi:MAG TPA: M20/M25/M40 family metallo-hydrolase [Solirubrobacteraceae bacterium]|nr:M20/M25/M40 family metallo-hydrolase [Solirubrobacteraceae bacterium]